MWFDLSPLESIAFLPLRVNMHELPWCSVRISIPEKCAVHIGTIILMLQAENWKELHNNTSFCSQWHRCTAHSAFISHLLLSHLQGIILRATSSWEERNLTHHILRDISSEKTWTWIFLEIGQCRWKRMLVVFFISIVLTTSGFSTYLF